MTVSLSEKGESTFLSPFSKDSDMGEKMLRKHGRYQAQVNEK
jgi:hypothetical protein